ncbi:DNA-binding transcriptional regulator, MarR family [Clostridium sp. DSM 8431]|uniref:MarR family winged helix-turn-helix transcriptional regulator n=1 Tax=Clostridium sp. DSM 8431 TaxID=1761781 RepID=UPI0008ECF37D|nr:MarR family transcriptional regulator [Clostridium sp. DSM 8431]SFU79661.1 DNA-binding transcriptional regulator, MarR family [Clostridium sp. DSM 8431]
MNKEVYIGQRVVCLARQVDRAIGKEISEYSISTIQAKIISYLFYQTKECTKDIFQKDIEENFGIRRSSVSSVLDKLEENKFIERKSCEKDARLKKIELTTEGVEMCKLIRNSIYKIEESLEDSLSSAELNFFLDIINRLSSKIDN